MPEPKNPLRLLPEMGQSIWYDYIRRDLLTDGTLFQMVADDDLRGMTTNPAIFAAAVSKGGLYDDDIRAAGRDASAEQAYERLAIRDVQFAADAFRPVWERTEGLDGYVSIEVSPRIARDTDATLAEARRLWSAVDRPNIMVKIPGTVEGLPAIRACLEEGIHINVTLLFGIPRYIEVMETFLQALESRARRGESVKGIHSVASFFISRVDTLIDARLDAENPEQAQALRGRAGVANARLAYAAFESTLLRSDRFEALSGLGASVQRPLWASTSTKDPKYPDTLYVDELIGPHTVNTVPPETYVAYRDHGDPAVRIASDLNGAEQLMRDLGALGIDIADVAARLEEEGVQKFDQAFASLLKTVSDRQAKLFT